MSISSHSSQFLSSCSPVLTSSTSPQRVQQPAPAKSAFEKFSALTARNSFVSSFAESTIYVAFSSILAIGLCELGLPLLNALADKHLTMGSLIAPHVLIGLFALIIVVGLLSGMYPALYLSSFWPVTALKGYIASGKAYLRNGLVIAQFCISISLLVGTLVVRDQIHFAQNKHLGFDKEHVLILQGIPIPRNLTSPRQAMTFVMTFRDQFETLPQVSTASLNTGVPGRDFDSMIFIPEQPANYEKTSLTYTFADEKYVEALNLKIVEGRNFSPADHATDATAFLVNQSAVKALGWQTALGKKFKRASGMGMAGPIIGVISDFHIGSLKQEIEPLVLPYLRRPPMYLAIRLHPGNVAEAISAVEETWKKLAPNQPFSYTFLDQDYARLYNREQQMSHVFQIFSGLAILIACLGLFGSGCIYHPTAHQRNRHSQNPWRLCLRHCVLTLQRLSQTRPRRQYHRLAYRILRNEPMAPELRLSHRSGHQHIYPERPHRPVHRATDRQLSSHQSCTSESGGSLAV